MSEPREVDGSGYTRWCGTERQWGELTVSVPFEWVSVDETGVSSGPIRRGEIIGGKHDGARLAPDPRFTITWNPDAFGGSTP